MPGFLDPAAPSIAAEYARYIDGDLLGKVITRNFLVNRLGFSHTDVYTPIGRYGDAMVKYATPGKVAHDAGDGHVDTDDGRVTFEIKFARINIANRARGSSSENWAFAKLLTSPGKVPKTYDLLIAIGILTLGLEDERYWHHLSQVHERLRADGCRANVEALPHEPDYLSICSFFILPRTRVPTNNFRISVGAVEASNYGQQRAWGHDEPRCRTVWNNALCALRAS